MFSNRYSLLLALLAGACGGGSSSDPDAALADAAPLPVDAQTEGTMTVRVLRQDEAQVGLVVIFHDAVGNEIADGLTDSAGEVSYSPMPVGGAVTVVREDQPNFVVLQSATDLPVDQTIVFHDELAVLTPLTPPYGSIDVTLPSTVADSYEVDSPCQRGASPSGAPGATVALSISDRCEGATEFPIAVFGVNGGLRTTTSAVTLTSPAAPPNLGAVIAPDSTAAVAIFALPVPNLVADLATGVVIAEHPQGRTNVDPNQAVATGMTANYPLSPEITTSIAGTLRLREMTQPINLATSQITNFRVPLTAAAGETQTLAGGLMPPGETLSLVTDSPLGVDFTLAGDAVCGDVGAADLNYASLAGEGADGRTYSWQIVRPFSNQVRLPSLAGANAGLYWPEQSFLTVESRVTVVALSNTDYAGFVTGPSVTREGFSLRFLPEGRIACTRLIRQL